MKLLSMAGAVAALMLLTAETLAAGAAFDTTHVQPVSVSTADGQVVCNVSGAFSQVPGHPDLFVGRGFGTGSLDYCHKLHNPLAFLALFHMDWQQHKLTLGEILLKSPVKTSSGVDLHNGYDPYVTQYDGTYWVAFECTAPAAVSTCVVPLDLEKKTLDLNRLSVPVEGTLGPHGSRKQVVGLLSASAPTLLTHAGKLFMYWQIDSFDNQLPENPLITRGAELQLDSHGKLWIAGSGGHPIKTDDPQRSALVHDVKHGDQKSDHVAVLSDAVSVGNKVVEIASVGGSGGKEICRSTHDVSPGCWRMEFAVSDNPIQHDTFGAHHLEVDGLPANLVEYPRVITDPNGHHYLMGNFGQPKAEPLSNRVLIPVKGLAYIPFEPEALAH
jgi:hypothetical protein